MTQHRHAPVSAAAISPTRRTPNRPRLWGALALGTTLLAGSAGAFITATGGMAVQIAPPASVKPGALLSPNILAFDELQNFLTPVDIVLDASSGAELKNPEDVKPVVIPRGTCLSSHYVHYQPAVDSSATGRVRFNRPIVGVALLQATLDATNVFGAPGTDYPVAPQCITAVSDCGMELNPDVLRVGALAVEVDFSALNPGDRIRVLTEGNPDRCHPLCLDDECAPGDGTD
jgi:hypothetical protein